ncbi:MAG: hypothetical protein WBA76_08135 [Phormidesmis sp.]
MNEDVPRSLSPRLGSSTSSNPDHFTARYWERTVKQKLLSLR